MNDKTYATAGSLPLIAEDLQRYGSESVYLCHTGTTYAQKLLQYHAYPILIDSDAPTHIVVHKSADWSEDNESLRCGSDRFTVEKLEDYTDGSALYQNNS